MVYCKEIWQVVGDDDKLYDSFKNIDVVISVLEKLSSSESIVINSLFQNNFTIKKGSLIDIVFPVELTLDSLKRKSFVYMMKNRARLNESLDTIYLNEVVKETLLDNDILSDVDLVCSDYISFNMNLDPDYKTYFDFFKGCIAKKAIKMMPIIMKNLVKSFQLVFVADGFEKIANLSDETIGESIIKNISKFDLLYILSLFLYHVRKKEVKLDEDNEIRKRDASYFCRIYGIDSKLLELIYKWSLNNNLVELENSVVKINQLGFSILSCGFEEKIAYISKIIGEYDVPSSLDLIDFYRFLHPKSDINNISDYGLIINNIKKMANDIRLLYGFGIIDFAMNKKDRVETLSFQKKEKDNDSKFLILSPTMDILIYMDRIDSEDLFFLRCFSELEIQNSIATGKVTEDSVATAIMLGLSGRDFIELLHRGAEKEIAQNVIFILEDWIGSFSNVSLEKRFVLNGSKQVIELLMHDKKLKQYVDVVLNENYLILKNVDKRVIVDLLGNEKVKIGYENI